MNADLSRLGIQPSNPSVRSVRTQQDKAGEIFNTQTKKLRTQQVKPGEIFIPQM